jgi:type III secretory pathway component EscT
MNLSILPNISSQLLPSNCQKNSITISYKFQILVEEMSAHLVLFYLAQKLFFNYLHSSCFKNLQNWCRNGPFPS